MISLKISNKKWREELTDLSDLDTQLFVGIIIRSVSHLCYHIFEKVLITKLNKKSIRMRYFLSNNIIITAVS